MEPTLLTFLFTCIAAFETTLLWRDEVFGAYDDVVIGAGSTVAYVTARGSGVLSVDFSISSMPAILDTLPSRFVTNDLHLEGSLLYTADTIGFVILDVSDPAKMDQVGAFTVPGGASSSVVYVLGTVVCVGATDSNAHFVDVSDPTAPTLLGTFAAAGSPRGIFLTATSAYIASSNGLEVVDITTVATPTIAGTYACRASAVVVSGTDAFLGVESPDELRAIDVSDPANMLVRGTLATTQSIPDFWLVGTLLYAASGSIGVQIFGVANPDSLSLIGTFNTPSYAIGSACTATNEMVVADFTNSILVVDTANPSMPQQVGQVGTTGSATGVAVTGDVVLLGDGSNMRVFDVTNPASPVELPSVAVGAGKMFTVGTLAYVTTFAGLTIVDVATPSAVVELGNVALSGSGTDVWVEGNTAYVTCWSSGGLHVVDVSDSMNPSRIGGYTGGGNAYGVMVVGSVVYVAMSLEGLVVFDVTTPMTPTVLGSLVTPGNARSVYVQGQIAYLAGDQGGFSLLDVSDNTNPQLVGSYLMDASRVRVVERTAYIANAINSVAILDVGDPTSPTLRASYLAGEPNDMYLVGNTMYVAAKGLRVVDVTPPTPTPTETTTMTLPTPTATATATATATRTRSQSETETSEVLEEATGTVTTEVLLTSTVVMLQSTPLPPGSTAAPAPATGTPTAAPGQTPGPGQTPTPGQPPDTRTVMKLNGPSESDLLDFTAERVRRGTAELKLTLEGAGFISDVEMVVTTSGVRLQDPLVVTLGAGSDEGLAATYSKNKDYVTHRVFTVTEAGVTKGQLAVRFAEKGFYTTLREVVKIEVTDMALEGAAAGYCDENPCSFEAQVDPDLPPGYGAAEDRREVAGSAAAGVAVLSASPGGGTKVGALALASRAQLCPGDGPEKLDRTLNPLGLTAGSGDYAEYHGAVFGGLIICVALAFVCSVVAVILGVRSGGAWSVRRFLLQGRFSWTLLPLSFVYGGSALSVITVGAYSGGVYYAWAGLLAVFVAAVPSYAIWVSYVCKSLAVFTPVEGTEDLSRVRRVFWGSSEWAPREEVADAEEWLALHHLVFDGYREGWQFFFVVELFEVLALSGLSAWVPRGDDGCWERAVIMACVITLHLFMIVRGLPYIAPYENVAEGVIAAVESAMLFCTVAAMGSASRPTDHAALKWAVWLSEVALWLVVAKTLTDFVIFFIDIKEEMCSGAGDEGSDDKPKDGPSDSPLLKDTVTFDRLDKDVEELLEGEEQVSLGSAPDVTSRELEVVAPLHQTTCPLLGGPVLLSQHSSVILGNPTPAGSATGSQFSM